MKVKINENLDPNIKVWYHVLPGEVFEVINCGINYKLIDQNLWIDIADCTVIEDNTAHPEEAKPIIPDCSRTDELFRHMYDKYSISLPMDELNEIIDVVYKTTSPKTSVEEVKESEYVSSVEEENAEHEEKLNNMRIALGIVGFKFQDKDLDMLVSVYELVLEHGGKLDLKRITEKEFEVNERHSVQITKTVE